MNNKNNRRGGKYIPPQQRQQPQVTEDDVKRAHLVAEQFAAELAEAMRVGNIVRDKFHELQEMAALQQMKIDALAQKAAETKAIAETLATAKAAAERAAAERVAAEKAAAERAAAEKAAAELAATERAAELAAAERNRLIGLVMTSISNLTNMHIRFAGGLCGVTGNGSNESIESIVAEIGMRMHQMGTHQIQDCLTALQAISK